MSMDRVNRLLQPLGIEKWLKPSPYPHVVYFLRGDQAVNKWCQCKYYKDFKKELRIQCGDAVSERVVVRAFKRTQWSHMNLNELREMWRLEQEGFCPLLGPVCYCSATGYVQVYRSRRRLRFILTYKVQRKVEGRREYGWCMKGARWRPCAERAGAGGGVRETGRQETWRPVSQVLLESKWPVVTARTVVVGESEVVGFGPHFEGKEKCVDALHTNVR